MWVHCFLFPGTVASEGNWRVPHPLPALVLCSHKGTEARVLGSCRAPATHTSPLGPPAGSSGSSLLAGGTTAGGSCGEAGQRRGSGGAEGRGQEQEGQGAVWPKTFQQ